MIRTQFIATMAVSPHLGKTEVFVGELLVAVPTYQIIPSKPGWYLSKPYVSIYIKKYSKIIILASLVTVFCANKSREVLIKFEESSRKFLVDCALSLNGFRFLYFPWKSRFSVCSSFENCDYIDDLFIRSANFEKKGVILKIYRISSL